MRRRNALLLGALLCASATPIAIAQQRADWRPDGPLDGREPDDPDELTPEERRHVPVLVLPRQVRAGRPFDFVVQVGVEPHVMTEAHYVDWVEVAVGGTRVFTADLSPDVGYPIVRVPLVLRAPADLTVRAHCNLHGTWRTRRAIPVR